jgi:ribosomal protein S18 acetylase RimI-like enzyme
MIRPANVDDADAILGLGVAAGLFPPDAGAFVRGIFLGSLDGSLGEGHDWVVDDEGQGPVAVAYVAPEKLTEGTFNLTMIAVRPDWQGQGRGGTLTRYLEEMLRDRGERVLLVDTSGTPEFERTRAFYLKNGYEREARIRDYYKDGDDKITFRKRLRPQTTVA